MSTLSLAIFVGLPGCGKTSLALPLARARGWTYISRDEIRAHRFMDLGPEAWKPLANEATEAAARAALARGESAVIDGATFAAAALRQRFAQAAQDHAARFLVIWVDCPVEEAQRRVARSNANHPAPSERDAARVLEVAARFQAPGPEAIHLDALHPLDQLQRELDAAIDRA